MGFFSFKWFLELLEEIIKFLVVFHSFLPLKNHIITYITFCFFLWRFCKHFCKFSRQSIILQNLYALIFVETNLIDDDEGTFCKKKKKSEIFKSKWKRNELIYSTYCHQDKSIYIQQQTTRQHPLTYLINMSFIIHSFFFFFFILISMLHII